MTPPLSGAGLQRTRVGSIVHECLSGRTYVDGGKARPTINPEEYLVTGCAIPGFIRVCRLRRKLNRPKPGDFRILRKWILVRP